MVPASLLSQHSPDPLKVRGTVPCKENIIFLHLAAVQDRSCSSASACQQLLLFAAADEVAVSPALRSRLNPFSLYSFFLPVFYILKERKCIRQPSGCRGTNHHVSCFAVLHLLQLSLQKFVLIVPAIPELTQ